MSADWPLSKLVGELEDEHERLDKFLHAIHEALADAVKNGVTHSQARHCVRSAYALSLMARDGQAFPISHSVRTQGVKEGA